MNSRGVRPRLVTPTSRCVLPHISIIFAGDVVSIPDALQESLHSRLSSLLQENKDMTDDVLQQRLQSLGLFFGGTTM